MPASSCSCSCSGTHLFIIEENGIHSHLFCIYVCYCVAQLFFIHYKKGGYFIIRSLHCTALYFFRTECCLNFMINMLLNLQTLLLGMAWNIITRMNSYRSHAGIMVLIWCHFEWTGKCKRTKNSWSRCKCIFLPWGSLGIFSRVECVWSRRATVVEWKRPNYSVLCSFLVWHTIIHRPIEVIISA